MPGGGIAGALRGRTLRLARWVTASPERQRRIQIGAALLAFQGTAFVLVANKLVVAHPSVIWIGFAMIAAGAYLLLAPSLLEERRPARAHRQGEGRKPGAPTLADRLVAKVTRNGRLDRIFPLLGLGIVAFDLLYNQYLTPTPQLLSTDVVVLGLAGACIVFPLVPARFSRERNFILLFFSALTLIFAVPLVILRLGHDPYSSVDEYTAALVAPQLAWVLNAVGTAVTYAGNDLFYIDQTNGQFTSVHIATSCSGLYSMGIFIAAFCGLVLSDYSRLTWRVGALLSAGVLLAYLANLLRMVIIVEVGYNYGSPALLWTHANLGDLIFLAWVVPFMWITYRLLDPAEGAREYADNSAFEAALRAQGIDPASVTEDDWFCASCFTKVAPAAGGKGADLCPSCGASLS